MDSATITVDVVNGAQLEAGVTSGAIVLVDVIYGQSITADVVTGARGNDGAPGPTGAGVPNGGTTGQVLKKASNANQDTVWGDPASGSVSSVNGESGAVILTTDDISDSGQVNKWATAAEKAKLGFIAITQAVDLDALEAASHTHANQATLDATTAIFTTAKDTKLSGIATGATANDTDANLKNRANHTGTQTASTISDFDAAADARISAQKATNNGLATLDGSGKVPSAQLPSFVDDVIEAANFAALPGTGESGKIYVTLDTNITYRWSGSAYVEISQSLALGETSTTAYRGDRGKIAYDHSQIIAGNPHGTTKTDVGLSNVPNVDATARANHTGTQLAATISDFNSAALTAAPAETATTIGNLIAGSINQVSPADTDRFGYSRTASSGILQYFTWASMKARLKEYFDTLYAAITHTHVKANITDFQHSITGTEHTFPGGTTTFLRADGTFAAPPGGGSATVSQVILDFGANETDGEVFTITDAAILTTSKIVSSIGWHSSCNRDPDEISSDPIFVSCEPLAGSMKVYASAKEGTISGKYAINYQIG